jgi:hypothetical protein
VARLYAIGSQHYLQAGVKKEGRGSLMIKVRSLKLNAAEDFGSSRKSTLTLMTAEQPEGIKRRRKACRQDFGGTTRVETQKQQSNQDAQRSPRKRDETGCPVMTGQVPHNADGTQRTETTKGTDPPQFPNKSSKGE